MTVEYSWISGELVSGIEAECCRAVAALRGGWWAVSFPAVMVPNELAWALDRWLHGGWSVQFIIEISVWALITSKRAWKQFCCGSKGLWILLFTLLSWECTHCACSSAARINDSKLLCCGGLAASSIQVVLFKAGGGDCQPPLCAQRSSVLETLS